MRLIIAGSRTFNLSSGDIDNYIHQKQITGIQEVVCGCGSTDEDKALKLMDTCGAAVSDKGVDLAGELWASYRGVPIKYVPAKWKKLGKPAGPKRNKEMAEYGDVLLLIWDGNSSGSKSMRNQMDKLGKTIYEIILEK